MTITPRYTFEIDEKSVERFWSKVRKGSALECWEWTAGVSSLNYGQFHAVIDGRRVNLRAHRVSFFLERGPLIPGKVLDHICRNTKCVNPTHLREVTNAENTFAGIGVTAMHSRKTRCAKGHPYAGDNLYEDPRGHRYCRACKREWARTKRKSRAKPKDSIERTTHD